MESLFYIGQRVVAIRSHSEGLFLKDEEFVVLDIKKMCCLYVIKINNRINDKGGMFCPDCNFTTDDKYLYFDQVSFAPIQEIGDMTFDEAIKLVNPNKKPTIEELLIKNL